MRAWLIGVLFWLVGQPGMAAPLPPSLQDARADLVLHEHVDADPSASLHLADALETWGRTDDAQALRTTLVNLLVQRLDGVATDPLMTVKKAIALAPSLPALAPKSPLAATWRRLVSQRVHMVPFVPDGESSPVQGWNGRPLKPLASALWGEETGAHPEVAVRVQVTHDAAFPLALGDLQLSWLGATFKCSRDSTEVKPLLAPGGAVGYLCFGHPAAAELGWMLDELRRVRQRAPTFAIEPTDLATDEAIRHWVQAWGSGQQDKLAAVLARQAPCESASRKRERCLDVSAVSAAAAGPSNSHSKWPAARAESVSWAVITWLAPWFSAAFIISWLLCAVLTSSSLTVAVFLHSLVAVVMMWGAAGVQVAIFIFTPHRSEDGMVPLLLSSSEFFAAVCGAWVAAYAHLFKTILEDYPPDTSFAEAVVDGLRRTFVYEGRSTRGQFWWFVLFTVLAPIPAYLVHRKLGATVSFLLYIPLLSAAARRLHDTGRNGWWVLLALFPGFGMLLLTFWLLGESRRSYPGEPEDEAPTRMGGIAKL